MAKGQDYNPIDLPTFTEEEACTSNIGLIEPTEYIAIGLARVEGPRGKKVRARRRNVTFEGEGRSSGKLRSSRSGRSTFDVICFNSARRPQLLAAMTADHGAKLIFNQEHQSHGPADADLQHEAKRQGLTLVGSPAMRTAKDGSSA